MVLVWGSPGAWGGGLAWRPGAGAAEATGANRMGADEIGADVKARLAEQPNASLAIVTLSRAQQHLVEDLLEAAGLRSRAPMSCGRVEGASACGGPA